MNQEAVKEDQENQENQENQDNQASQEGPGTNIIRRIRNIRRF